MLFPPFQTVLNMDVSEFTPYVFQVLAQLLEFRPQGLGDAYKALFPPLLSPSIWSREGNVPALTRLMRAYLEKPPADFVAEYLQGMLGIFQKLVASSKNEVNGLDLLNSVTLYMPPASMNVLYPTIYEVLLTRLQAKRTPRFKRCITNYFCLWAGKFGGQAWVSVLDSMQAGLGMNLIVNVWLKRYETDMPTNRMEIKVTLVGLCRLMPCISTDAMAVAACTTVLVKLLSGDGAVGAPAQDDEPPIELEVSSDSTFNTLQFARRAVFDPFADITDVQGMVVQALRALPALPPLSDKKDQAKLQALLQSG
uniref:Exportin-2 C-terminal domain-containing protein n=1 Tax=Grammatophora oceanica TaxID=210454 RepID=A0A7S1YF25_9STRA|mmetsp:Transcript_43432/g.64416  ORF Transcript_43432/g.64416 Transcript_43432/m.64416 type:complete len:309 (+) Transcript_43432:1-927(+)